MLSSGCFEQPLQIKRAASQLEAKRQFFPLLPDFTTGGKEPRKVTGPPLMTKAAGCPPQVCGVRGPTR